MGGEAFEGPRWDGKRQEEAEAGLLAGLPAGGIIQCPLKEGPPFSSSVVRATQAGP